MSTTAAESPPAAVASPWLVVVPVAGFAWFWAVWFAPVLTAPGGGSPLNLFVPMVWFLPIALFWGVFSCIRHIWAGSIAVRAAWISVPVLAVGLPFLAVTDLGLMVRVRLSEAALRAGVAEPVATDERGYHAERWLGSFSVYRTWQHDGGVYLFTGAEFAGPTGIASIPSGAILPPRVTRYHLYDDWYRFVYHDD